MTTQFKNLIFEGGGVRGIAYVGAMQGLHNRGILEDISRVGGTSAGAINALIFALGYDIQEQKTIIESTNFKDFMDSSFGVIRNVRRLAKEFGWHHGDFFDNYIGELIKNKLGDKRATFKDLNTHAKSGTSKSPRKLDLYVVGTNLSTGFAEVFSYERHPNMELAKAIRISMSIPLFFTAVRLVEEGDVYVDGGVVLNYPVKLFDRERYILPIDSAAARRTKYYNEENARFQLVRPGISPYIYNCQTLGLRLDKKEEISLFRYNEPIQNKPIKSFTDYARKLIDAFMNAQENIHLHSDDWQRTVYINTKSVGTIDFNISETTKRELIEHGIQGVEHYFSWFDDLSETPVNRINK